MKSILILCDSLPGALTSTGAMVEALRDELVRRGHAVELAGMGSEEIVDAYPWAIRSARLKTNSIAFRALTEFLVSLRLALRLFLGIVTRRLPRPDLVVLFTPSLFLCLPAAALKLVSSCRVYLVQRDIVPDWLIASGRVKKGAATSILFALKNFSLRRADRIGIECEENLAYFPSATHSKIEVLHNWRNFDRAESSARPPQQDAVFIYGGRVGHVQGFDRFLRPFIALGRPEARLRIHCDDRGRAEIESMGFSPQELAQVEVLPMLDEERFLQAAEHASFGVVTLAPQMQTHNIPGKTLAYLAAGIPVIAIGPRQAALGRVIAELGIGRYVDAANEHAIRDTLRELLDDPAARASATAAVGPAKQVFGTASAADLILAVCAETRR